jgi:hypothetical protein
MKTSFNIAWVDDNFNDPNMNLDKQLSRKLIRKNGFSLVADDIYAEVTNDNIDLVLDHLANTIDLSNSYDLILIDYELGNNTTGEKIANKFRAKLPSTDILFYSGKQNAEDLRQLIADENVDGVNCVGRRDLVNGTYTVIENIINRSHKISTLRGLILNSVCEMDNMIIDIICKYGTTGPTETSLVKNKAIELINPRATTPQKAHLMLKSIEDLLSHKNMMSGRLFSILELIKDNIGLSDNQINLLSTYRTDILDLRTTAAHAKEATCQATGQSMLQFKNVEYKRCDIDNICKKIVEHENSIKSILDNLN